MDDRIRTRYAYWRERGAGDERIPLTASQALSYAREEARMAELDIDWDFTPGRAGAFVVGTLAVDGREVRVLVGDDEPVDWGDLEPSERERENASAYWIGAECDGAEDSIGGVDVIDLEGYLQRDWEDAARYALLEYLLPEIAWKIEQAQIAAERETVEREHWEARDTVTVSC